MGRNQVWPRSRSESHREMGPALLLDSVLRWEVIRHSVQTEAGLPDTCD